MASYHDRWPSHSDGHSSSRSSASRRSHRPREHSPEPSRIRPEARYTTSSRYPSSSYYSSRGTPSRPAHTPNSAAKRPWPPAPAVEDEKDSLARESIASTAYSDISETPSRGSVDQQPIILDVEPPKASTPPKACPANRTGRQQRHGSINMSSPEKPLARGRSESTAAELDLPETPIFTRRAPSPYSYNPKAQDASTTLSTDSGYYSDKKRDSGLGIDSFTSSALKGEGRPRNRYENEPQAADDDDNASSVSSRGGRAPAPYSFSKANLPDRAARPPSRDFPKNEAQPRLAELKAEAFEPKRQSSESASNPTRPRFDTTHSAPYPLEVSMPGQLGNRSSSSRPGSPIENQAVLSSSPPRSPRSNSFFGKTESPRSARSSISGSVSGSRPASPITAYGSAAPRPEEGLRRSSTFPVVLDDRSQRTSRLSSSAHVDDAIPSPSSANSSALPYPVDDINIMPSEEDRRYRGKALGEPFVPRPNPYSSRPSTRDSPLPSPVNSRPGSLEMPHMGSIFQSRQGLDATLPALAVGTAALMSPTREPESPLVARASVLGSNRSRARCLYQQSDRNYDGWFALNRCANFDLCPACYDRYIASTMFANYFKQVYRREPNPHVSCAFSTPWVKVAWRLTLQQQRSDLSLLYNVAQASESEWACPGGNREARAWYTIYDRQGVAIPGLDVCPCDVNRIEALLPSLRGVFQESHNSGRKRRCNLRTTSTRFREYVDLLIEIDSSTGPYSGPPNMTDFIELAQLKAQMRECLRDDLILDQGWHFAPQLPEFTVCEECYSAVVWPAIANNSSVACKFKRTPEWLDEEKAAGVGSSSRAAPPPLQGISCQLYSDRMRQVFWTAIKSDDFTYLMRKAKERKQVEVGLHKDMAAITAELKDLEKSLAKAGDRQQLENHPRRISLLNEIGKISEDWRRWE